MTNENKKQSKINFKFILLLAILVLIVGAFVDAKYLSVKRLRVQNISIKDESIPKSFHKSKIFIFSDVFDDINQLGKVKEQVKKEKPDFIIFLGNLLPKENNDLIQEYLKEMDAPLGKYALLSKNDYQNDLEKTKKIFSNADFRLQETSRINVYNKTNEKIQFVFIDYDGPGIESSEKIIESIDLESFALAFSYNPKQIESVNTGIHTLFSSKNPYAKVNIPFLNNVLYKDKHYNKHKVIDNVNLRLTSGIATHEPKFRLFSSPDLISLTLRSSK